MNNSFQNKKEEEDFEFNFNRYFGALLNIVALIIILFIISFFYKNYYNDRANFYVGSENKKVDTLQVGVKLDLKDKRSIIAFNTNINRQIVSLNQLKNNIEESDKSKKDDIKFYFSIIGFVIAIIGFFGFKSIHDSKEIAIKNAIDEAKTVSKNILDTETKKIISEKLQTFSEKIDEIKGDYEELKNSLETIAELQGIVSDLKIRIDYFEENTKNEEKEKFKIDIHTTEKQMSPNNPQGFDEFKDKDEFDI